MDWIDLAQNMDKWRALVSAGIFLTVELLLSYKCRLIFPLCRAVNK